MKSIIFGALFVILAISDFQDPNREVVIKMLPFIPISPLLLVAGVVMVVLGAISLIGRFKKDNEQKW